MPPSHFLVRRCGALAPLRAAMTCAAALLVARAAAAPVSWRPLVPLGVSS
jgi:hypothetical protein